MENENVISEIIEVSKKNEAESEINTEFLNLIGQKSETVVITDTPASTDAQATTSETPREDVNGMNSEALITIFDLIVSKGGAFAIQLFAKKKVSSSSLALTKSEINKIKPICDRLYEKHLTGANIKDEYLLLIMLVTIYVPAFGIALETGTDIRKKDKKEVETEAQTTEKAGKKKNYYKSKQAGYDIFE